jgi:NAD-dependent DNA ligase
MEQSKLDKLKIAANQFYLGLYMDQPRLTDEEYDKLAKEFESEYLDNVKSLVEWDKYVTLENVHEDPLNKIILQNNNFIKAISQFINENSDPLEGGWNYLNPKYDGCAIKAYYKNGKLYRIQSTPDENFGIVRTKAFWDLFPSELEDKSIIALRGEVLVDANQYGELARNKANGLTNSKYKDDEVKQECFIRIYKIQFNDDNSNTHQKEALSKLPILTAVRNRQGYPNGVKDVYFAPAVKIPLSTISNEMKPFIEEGSAKFQMDGIVLYSDKFTQGFKFYFTEYAITTVTNVIWNKKSNGSYSAVVEFDGVTLGDKWIERASAGGVNNLIGESEGSPGAFGIGAKIKVILANTTIPKVIEVLEPSTNFNWPTCECGYTMKAPNDVYGNVLKCGNKEVCSSRLKLWRLEFYSWVINDLDAVNRGWKSVKDLIDDDPLFMLYELHIDRWDPYDKVKENKDPSDWDSFIEAIVACDLNNDQELESIKEFLNQNFRFSDLQWDLMEINLKTAITIIKEMYNITIEEILNLYNKNI